MTCCGVEIKGSDAVLALATANGATIEHLAVATKEITLADDDEAVNVKAFRAQLEAFVQAHRIEHIAIKKRGKKGEFAGGPTTFKIETLFQLLEGCTVTLLAPQTISATQKKQAFALPSSLNKYQHEAFLTACTALVRSAN